MKPFMFVTVGSRFESISVAGTFAVAAYESRIQVDSFEFFELLWLRTFGQIIHRAVNERSNDALVALADLTKPSGIMPKFFSFET